MTNAAIEPSPRRSRSSSAGFAVTGLLLVLVVAGLVLFGDVDQLGTALASFQWWLVPPILGLILAGYLVRFGRWHLYLGALAVPPLPVAMSALVFLSGFTMTVTPGKVGEVIKCVALRRLTGVPVSRTSAIVLAERLTDIVAMLALAAIGLVQFAYGRSLLGVICLGVVAAILLLQRPHRMEQILRVAEKWPVIGRFTGQATMFVAASETLLRPRVLVVGSALGIVSWAAECLALYAVLVGLGMPASWHLLLVATFVMATSTLLGAVSMLPGGLGVADASVAGMLILLVGDDGMTRGMAAAAALLIRFATLWFGTLLGFVALGVLHVMQQQHGGDLATGWSDAEHA